MKGSGARSTTRLWSRSSPWSTARRESTAKRSMASRVGVRRPADKRCFVPLAPGPLATHPFPPGPPVHPHCPLASLREQSGGVTYAVDGQGGGGGLDVAFPAAPATGGSHRLRGGRIAGRGRFGEQMLEPRYLSAAGLSSRLPTRFGVAVVGTSLLHLALLRPREGLWHPLLFPRRPLCFRGLSYTTGPQYATPFQPTYQDDYLDSDSGASLLAR